MNQELIINQFITYRQIKSQFGKLMVLDYFIKSAHLFYKLNIIRFIHTMVMISILSLRMGFKTFIFNYS